MSDRLERRAIRWLWASRMVGPLAVVANLTIAAVSLRQGRWELVPIGVAAATVAGLSGLWAWSQPAHRRRRPRPGPGRPPAPRGYHYEGSDLVRDQPGRSRTLSHEEARAAWLKERAPE